MSRIIKKVFDILFILIILVLVGYFALRINKTIEIYNVKTGSMEDNIHAGDYVLIVKQKNYEIGDVVTFKKDGYLVTHRIIKKNNDLFVTKGDANNDEDGPIIQDQIVGKVVLIGGVLNVIIKFKYFIASVFVSLYLVTCYCFGEKEDTNVNEKVTNDKEDIINKEDSDKIKDNNELISNKEEVEIKPVLKNEEVIASDEVKEDKNIILDSNKTDYENKNNSIDKPKVKKKTNKKKKSNSNKKVSSVSDKKSNNKVNSNSKNNQKKGNGSSRKKKNNRKKNSNKKSTEVK